MASVGAGSLPASVPDTHIESDSESDEGSSKSPGRSSTDSEDGEADFDDMSTEKLHSGSDLTAQVDSSTGQLLDDWYESEELNDIPEADSEDDKQIVSEEEFNGDSDV